MGDKEMYCAYKSVIVSLSIVLFGFSTIIFADSLTELQISAGEEIQYTVGEIIIIDNDNQKESYIIDSLDNGTLNLTKYIQNGVEMNVVGKLYPIPQNQLPLEVTALINDQSMFVSPYVVGSAEYINDINVKLQLFSSDFDSDYESNYFFYDEGFETFLRVNHYWVGEILITPTFKIFALVDGNYISNGGLTLNVIGNYGDVDIAINQILILAFVVVVALASIFAVKKLVGLANKT